jgi:GAF domain-containing protein
MEPNKKAGRYGRIYKQLEALMSTAAYPLSRMATTTAVLHHKMPQFFWTGFYLLVDDALLVHAYQGPVACMQLEKDTGVCWAGINRKETVVVPDVHLFP